MAAGEKLRIIIVEDSLITVRAVRQMLDAQPDMSVVHVARTGQDGVRRALELRPDVVLMDIHLPDIDGIQAAWLIASKRPRESGGAPWRPARRTALQYRGTRCRLK